MPAPIVRTSPTEQAVAHLAGRLQTSDERLLWVPTSPDVLLRRVDAILAARRTTAD